MRQLATPGEFARGWPIVLASGVGIALGLSPIPFYEISLFAPALAKEFGWGFGSIMAGVFFMMCGSMIASPLVGILADRYGARRVALSSIVCFAICLGLFSLQSGSLPLYFANWFLMALTGAGTLPITWTRTINQYFDLKKGLALGLALTGTGVSAFFLRPATAVVMASFGWRRAFLFLALLPCVVSLPLAWACLRRPKGSAPNSTASRAAPPDGHSFAEAIRDRRFWLIGLGILPVSFAISGPIANLDAILRSHGVNRATILSVAPFVGLAVVVGRAAGGWMLDRIWAPLVALGLFSVSAGASWVLVQGPTASSWVSFGVIGLGLAAGLEFDLMAFMTARYFGTRHYGGIYGMQFAFFGLGSGIAPWAYGRVFDVAKTFTGVVDAGAAAMVVGGFVLLFLGRYRYPARALSP